jgi:hypothetical protein
METSGEVKHEALGVVGAAAESTVGRHEYNIRKKFTKKPTAPTEKT